MAKAIHLLVSKIAYEELLKSVDRNLPIYELIVNGIVEKDHGLDRVRIFCDQPQEKHIRQFIKKSHPHLIFAVERVVFLYGAEKYKRLLG